MARVLLTGATGVLGRALLPRLHEHDVVAASRRPGPESGATAVMDLRSGAGVAEATRGVEVVVHCASDAMGPKATDVDGLRRMIEAAPEARFVYPSIVGVDAVAFPYYKAKLAAERLLADSGVEHAIVRFTQFHEFPHQLASLPVPVTPAFFRTQPIAASEAAAVLAGAVEGPGGRRPDVGGPEVHGLRHLVKRVMKATGRRAPVLPVPMPGLRGFAAGQNLAPDHRVGRITWEEHFQEFLRRRADGVTRRTRQRPA